MGQYGIRKKSDFEKTFQQDPNHTYQLLSEEKDQLVLINKIERLTRAFPGQTENLCGLIKKQTSQEHCLTQNKRPHLWMKNKKILHCNT